MKKYKKQILSIILIILFQTITYFFVKFSPIKVNIIGSSINDKIPFISYFIYPYISWYLMLFLIPFILSIRDDKKFNIYLKTTFVCICVATIIYFLYPTAIIRDGIETHTFTDKIVNVIYLLDTPNVNCFPSMHCIISFIFIFVTIRNGNLSRSFRVITFFWSLLVILSTMFVKQHIILDVVSAFVLSFAVYMIINFKCKKCNF
ncbi:MAG: phosphatase PAP2 family protein [bacterium]|nr:phosphatase PAP2 family protein [bacterium]